MSRKNKGPFFDKKYLSRVGLYAVVTIFAIGVIIYLGYHMSGSLKDGIDIMYAESESILGSVKGEAYIIRDETPINEAVGSGYLSPTVRDGDRVRVGARVADVYNTSSSVTQNKISLIEDQIEFYEKCLNTHLSVGDTSSVDNEISSAVTSIRRAAAIGNLSGAVSVKPSLTINIRRLGVLTGKVTDYAAQIASLNAELSSLRASLGPVIKTVYAPSSGYYFSSTDGYEGVFSSADIDAVTYSDVIAMIDEAATRGENAETGSAGKIVNSFKWYAACRMSAAEAANYTVGKEYDVTLSNNASAPVGMKLYKILTNATDAVALFECSVMPDSFDYTRSQEFKAVYEEVAGYKIPVSAVRMHDGFEGVYILDEVTVAFRRISVIDEENGYFLCEAVTEEVGDATAETEAETSVSEESSSDEVYYPFLKENDIIIKSGTGLYVGMTYNPKGR